METFASEIRRRLGPPAALDVWPLISIVVPNRDGADHLVRLLRGLRERTDYPRFELIVVDNGSRDDSLDLLRSAEASFSITILANPHNETFSDACNQGAAAASGELLLFLNNDVEPLEPGWLRELCACLQRDRVGLAGATLVYPAPDSKWGYRVQHRAIEIREEDGVLGPDRRSYGDEPFAKGFGEDADSAVPSGACMLIERELFERVGGFTHGYVYGGEDIDLGLKVLEQGRRVVCCGRSILIHRLGSTRVRDSAEERQARERGNQRLFWERWGPRMRREFELGRGGGEPALALGFCLKSREPRPPGGDPVGALGAELRRRGHRCVELCEEDVEDLRGLDYDVAVHVRGPVRYIPKPAQLNVLWVVSHLDALTAIECNRYDLVLTESRELQRRLDDGGVEAPVAVLGTSGDDAAGTAERLVAAVESRVQELDFPLRITP